MTAPHDPTTDTADDIWPPTLISVVREADAVARTHEHPDAQAAAAEALRGILSVARTHDLVDLTAAPAGDAAPFVVRRAA